MIYELNEISENVKNLFDGWEETLIYSCLQQVMGKVLVTDKENPKAACAFIGCFGFYAGASSFSRYKELKSKWIRNQRSAENI